MSASPTAQLPVEVELALEVMPCQAMRRSYDSAQQPHACAYCAEWGFYHSYDYANSGPPEPPSTGLPVVYAGKRPLIPELLSGCRKAPIVCVGINPNLPGWTSSTRNAIHPYFDDLLQFIHYFRYRTRDKLRIPEDDYETLIGVTPDNPSTARPLKPEGQMIPVERSLVLMYEQYQTLLDGLAARKNWQNHKLAVGEDIAYANMVACPSTHWVVTASTEDAQMPVMGQIRAKGIVTECFFKRKYFLRQLFQSLPAVILVFSQTTAREFISALRTRFSMGNPEPTESLAQLFRREIRLRYGTLSDGRVLDARVIFMPHASARPEEFAQMRGLCLDRLEEPVQQSPPPGFASAPVIDVQGVIYPGLLDLHNHLAYNILPLWKPARRFDNRSQWQSCAKYRREVTEPMATLVRGGQDILKAIIRYIEVKLLVGGVTSGQGMKSRFGGNQFYKGLVRNFELPDDPSLPEADSHVQDLTPEKLPQFRSDLNSGRMMFFHLAEGLDMAARQQFTLLDQNALLRSNLIGIHSLGLRPAHYQKMQQAGSRVVWSPLSNFTLYGETINPKQLVDTQVLFGLGSDWTPSGSRNLLLELKVAWLCSQNTGSVLSFRALLEAATREAAQAAGWGAKLGTLEPGKLADILVLDHRVPDPFENLVQATEREVRLVLIGGQARYGDTKVLQLLGLPAADLETLQVGGRAKQLFLKQTGSPLAGITFAAARRRLETAMSDLATLRVQPAIAFEPLSDEPMIELELDMQVDDVDMEAMLMADLALLASVPLDPVTVIDDLDYFDALEAIPHLPAFLKGAGGLRGFYF